MTAHPCRAFWVAHASNFPATAADNIRRTPGTLARQAIISIALNH
jgi:hypothetical protein